MKKAAIIHGTRGSPNGNWFQSVAVELQADGFQIYVPQCPTPEDQTLENWLKCFDSKVGNLDEHSLLIGHSIGAVFVLRLLERLKTPIRAAILVAGFTGRLGLPEYDALNSSFVADPFDWNKIRSNAADFICLSGEKDPYVPFEQGKEIAESLAVAHIVIKGGGHLNAEFGYTSFPRVREELANAGVFGKVTNKVTRQHT